MSRTHLTLAMVAVSVLFTASGAQAVVNVGDQVDFEVQTLNEQTISSKSLDGDIAVLEFWQMSCAICMGQMPHMAALNRRYSRKGVRLVGVNLDGTPAQLPAFMKTKGITWEMVADEKAWASDVSRHLGINTIPLAVIISPQGQLLWKGSPADIDKPLVEAVKTVAAERKQLAAQLEQLLTELTSEGGYENALTVLEQIPEYQLYDQKVARQAKPLAEALDVPEASSALQAHPEIARQLPAIKAGLYVAKGKLANAGKAHGQGKYPVAYRFYVDVAQRAGGTQLGRKAATRAADYEADPALAATVSRVKVKAGSAALYAIAQAHVQAGRLDMARDRFQRAVEADPDSPFADQARLALTELGAAG